VLRESEEPIEITFDTANAPPSFGDFFNVVMVARFLATSGLDVSFRIRDTGARRSDWSDLTPAQQDAHVDDCLSLASVLLDSKAVVQRFDRPWRDDPNAVASPLECQTHPAYMLSESILHVLIEERGWNLPDEFLLTARDFTIPLARPFSPFVSWHVRRGVWDRGRDSTASGILADIRQLRQAFPEHDVMLFSSPAGIDFALQQLNMSAGEFDRVVTQPETGFLAAAPYVVASDFYFQRRGGGLSQFAVYSALPYLILNDHASYYYFRQGDRLVPWASKEQKYVIRRGVGSLPITNFLRN